MIVSTSHPQSFIYLLDARLLRKLAVIRLEDIAKSIDVIERPLYHQFDLLIAAQSCGSINTYKLNDG